MFAAMLGIADQPPALRIDHPIEQLQGHLADDCGQFVGNLADVEDAVVDGKWHGAADPSDLSGA